MTERRMTELPFMIIDMVETPPTKPTGKRTIADLDELSAIPDGGGVLVQYGSKTFKMTKINFLDQLSQARLKTLSGQTFAYASLYTEDGQAESPVRSQVSNIAESLYTGFASNGPDSGATADAVNSKIVITDTGSYLVNAQMSFSGTVSATFHFYLKIISDSPVTDLVGARATRKLGTGGDVGSCSFSGIVELTNGDEVGIYISSEADTKTINTHHSQFSLVKVP